METALLTAILIGLIALPIYTIYGIRKIATPTTGPMIDSDSRQGEALLIIDMQEDFTTLAGRGDWDTIALEDCMQNIASLATETRAKGEPVVVIRQVYEGWWANALNGFFNDGRGNANSTGRKLDPRLQVTPDIDIEKPYGDAFSNPELDQFLAERNIGSLRLVGLDGAHCIKNTAHGGLNRGYRVVIEDSGILSASQRKWITERNRLTERGATVSTRP